MISALGAVHMTAALAALVLGAFVLLDAKGTAFHRAIGMGYVIAMITVNLSSFGLYRLLGVFGPFHALALLSLAMVICGMVPVVRRGKDWLGRHYRFMSRSYVGLLAAAAAEALVRVPATQALMQPASQAITISMGIAVLFAIVSVLALRRLERRVLAGVQTGA
jgi:uncharacterized membrane protein